MDFDPNPHAAPEFKAPGASPEPRRRCPAETILTTVGIRAGRITPRALVRDVARQTGLDRRRVNKAVRELVECGELAYTYHLGCSFIEKSFQRPVWLSAGLVLVPEGLDLPEPSGRTALVVRNGAAFGDGRHATTRLALRGIELVCACGGFKAAGSYPAALDIGTGTGVLAIAAVKLGGFSVLALDRDACALSEAAQNAALNHVQARIRISGQPLDSLDRRFQMISANLRYPTLKGLAPLVAERLDHRGWLVLSGFRPHECQDLLRTYIQAHFRLQRREVENNWTALVLQKL